MLILFIVITSILLFFISSSINYQFDIITNTPVGTPPQGISSTPSIPSITNTPPNTKTEVVPGQQPTKNNKPNNNDNALMDNVNKYRASKNLPPIPISQDAWLVAATHNWDLKNNNTGWSGQGQQGCSAHSWSNQPGKWVGCCYNLSQPNGNCMWPKPKEIAGSTMQGFEIGSSGMPNMTPDSALQMWANSPLHNDVMINANMWTGPWKGFGCSLNENEQSCWFLK